MPKYGGGNLPPGMVPGGGGYGSGSGIAGQNAGNYGDYGYDMPDRVRGPSGRNWIGLGGLTGAQKNKLGVGGPGSYATYLSNTGQLNNPNVYVAPGETAFAATPDYTMYEDYKNGKIQFGMDGRTLGGLGHDLPYGTIYNGVNVNDPGGINNNWGAGSHDRFGHGGVNLENQQGGQNVAQYQNQQQLGQQFGPQSGDPMYNQKKASYDKQMKNATYAGNGQFNFSNGGSMVMPGYFDPNQKNPDGSYKMYPQGNGGNQATDPYQLPPGSLGPNRVNPNFTGQTFYGPGPSSQPQQQYPNQMPGGPGQISTVGGGMGPTTDPNMGGGIRNGSNIQPDQYGNAPGTYYGGGPRPRPGGLSPAQLAAMQPGSMGRPPQGAFGQQNPTRFVPGFQPNASQGFGRGTINPYQPQQRQFKNTVW